MGIYDNQIKKKMELADNEDEVNTSAAASPFLGILRTLDDAYNQFRLCKLNITIGGDNRAVYAYLTAWPGFADMLLDEIKCIRPNSAEVDELHEVVENLHIKILELNRKNHYSKDGIKPPKELVNEIRNVTRLILVKCQECGLRIHTYSNQKTNFSDILETRFTAGV